MVLFQSIWLLGNYIRDKKLKALPESERIAVGTFTKEFISLDLWSYFTITPTWLKLTTDGNFTNSWIYASGCETLSKLYSDLDVTSLSRVFLNLGAGGYNGFQLFLPANMGNAIALKMMSEFSSGLSFKEASENVRKDVTLNDIEWIVNTKVEAGIAGNVSSFKDVQSRSEPFYLIEPLITTPIVTTTAVTSYNQNSATVGGNVTNNGGATVTEKGIYWGTTQNPETTGTKLQIGNGTGVYSTTLSGLNPFTTYYVKAYAINSAGTNYGAQISFTTPANIVIPTVATTAISNITQTTATTGGNVTSDGGSGVLVRGVCWSTSANPTTANNVTTDGTGTGSFTSNITGLSAGTTYHVRAYASNGVNISYGADITFTTLTNPVPPTVTTTAISNITQTTATTGGNVTSDGGSGVLVRGVCWSTSANPTTANNVTTDGTGTGSFTSNITGLSAGTTYHVRAYASNSVNISYGADFTFTTLTNPVPPTVTTTAISNITQTTATTGGNVTSDGGSGVLVRGVCWSTSANPTTANNVTTDGTGTGSFPSNITGLSAGTTYHVRAYASNSVNISYGADITFTTLTNPVPPTVTTTAISNITQTTATTGGNVTSDGGSDVLVRGVCWSTSANPTTANNVTIDGPGTGSFTSNIMSLTAGTTYHVRAYARNDVNISYGADITFTSLTNPVPPTVITTAISNITQTTATTGGNVTSDGGSDVLVRGVCWSISANPTTANNVTTDGTGTGSFTSNITGLSAGTTYHVRAYARNGVNISYGADRTFTTSAPTPVAPTVTTTAVSNITQTSVTTGGNVTAAGSSGVIVRGVCWSTSANPTTTDNVTTDGAGTGSYTSNITGLTAGTTYHVRAYARNNEDIAYGADRTFTTSAPTPVAPTVITTAVSNITQTSVTTGGNVTAAGSSGVIVRGVCWSTSANPTTTDNVTTDGAGTGSYTSNITGLTAGTTYHVRAYARNNEDIAYGADRTFRQVPPLQ